MNLYEAIYVRQSVRKFQMKPIDELTMKHIRRYIQAVSPLYDEIRWHIELLDGKAQKKTLKGPWKADAPHYMVFYTEESRKAVRNAGFILEQLVLYLVTKGIGSCFQGGVHTTCQPDEAKGLKPVMVVAFGMGRECIERDLKEVRRMRLQDMMVAKEEIGEDMKTLLRTARLAPSAFNAQPWRFVVYHNRIHVFERKQWKWMPAIGKTKDFDIGVVLSHFVLAAEELWLQCEVQRMESISEKNMKNYEYAATIVIE